MQYIGRFAPSPSGALHFGSLVTALGSYLQAKSQGGKWLVRIEDIDPPREVKGAAAAILSSLEAFGLEWDDSVLYQHTRLDAYQAQIDSWLSKNQAYYCNCSRKQIKEMGGIYQAHCRNLHQKPCQDAFSIRLTLDEPITSFEDLHLGLQQLNPEMASEDFIIKRRDGLFAYNLAVVLDDIYQGVTEVVRGADLIEPTGRQMSLYKKLHKAPVRYLHLPLALNQEGHKLSKQNHARPIDSKKPASTLASALAFLGHPLPKELEGAPVTQSLQWAKKEWQLTRVPKTSSVITAF